jgi:2-keto-4-pentenoate hydratase/2-oxohepta-3-ene-1,7-dioic acid hydratase in catechol pathway
MRFARIATQAGPRFARADGEEWRIIEGDPFSGLASDGRPVDTDGVVSMEAARLLSPSVPQVVLGMAHNAAPAGVGLPAQAFLKSARTVAGPGDAIVIDEALGTMNVEGELAVVIGRHARNLTPSNALEAVFGLTIGNDVTAADQNALDTLLTQSKNGDGYTPLGPWIDTDLTDMDARGVRVIVDGELVASGSTAGLVRGVIDQLVYLTTYTTLGPGDVILGGCPDALAPVTAGQLVRIEIDGIGSLENPVRSLEHGAGASDQPGASDLKETSGATVN